MKKLFEENDISIQKHLKKNFNIGQEDYIKYKEVLIEYFPKSFRQFYSDQKEFYIAKIEHNASVEESYVSTPIMVFDDCAVGGIKNPYFDTFHARNGLYLYIFNDGLKSCFLKRTNASLVKIPVIKDFKIDSNNVNKQSRNFSFEAIGDKFSIYEILMVMLISKGVISSDIVNNKDIIQLLKDLENYTFIQQQFRCS